MTVEQTIINAIQAQLLAITPANGYSFDIAGKVYEWHDSQIDEAALPAIVFRDIANEIDEDNELLHILAVEVDIVAGGNSSPAAVRGYKQDILTAMYEMLKTDAVAGGKFVSSETEVEKDKKRLTYCTMKFEFEYITEVFAI